MKNEERKLSTQKSSFVIPRLFLKALRRIRFELDEDKNSHSKWQKLAQNRRSLISSTAAFDVRDGRKLKPLNDLPEDIIIALQKLTPLDPANDEIPTRVECSFSNEARRRFEQDGCKLVGENTIHFSCRCNHATKFGVILNQCATDGIDNFYTQLSVARMIELSIDLSDSSSPTDTNIRVGQTILSRRKAIIVNINAVQSKWYGTELLVVIISILASILIIDVGVEQVKMTSLANYGSITALFQSVRRKNLLGGLSFITLFSFWGHTDRVEFLNTPWLQMLTFSVEIFNTMGCTLLWLIHGRSVLPSFTAGDETIANYAAVRAMSYVSSVFVFYALFGWLNLWRMRLFKQHYINLHRRVASKLKHLCARDFWYKIWLYNIINNHSWCSF